MAIGEQADDQSFDVIGLADDHLADFTKKRTHKRACPLNFTVYCSNSSIHRFALNNKFLWTGKPENVFKKFWPGEFKQRSWRRQEAEFGVEVSSASLRRRLLRANRGAV